MDSQATVERQLPKTPEQEPADTPPSRATIFALRGVSLGASYGCWFLAKWLHDATPIGRPWGSWVVVIAGTLCVLFLLLGAVVPDRLLHRIWRRIGKALVFLLMIS